MSVASLLLLAILVSFTNGDCGGRDKGKEIVEVLIWSGGSWAGFMHGDTLPTPNYLGHEVDKRPWNCPIDCRFTGDKNRVANVDAVIFEAQPITSYYDEYKRKPPQFPQKFPNQMWLNHGYETHHYFHLYGDPGYLNYIDGNFTFYRDSFVPITFHCFWGGVKSRADLLKPHPPKYKDKCLAWMATNCGSGGATARTAYVQNLMEYMQVDSFGKCLHTKDVPKEMDFPIYSNHGESMKNKIKVFEEYKFVLTFENNNVTDYVTEKIMNVFQAQAVPVYMGAPTIDHWVPGPNSVVKVSDFEGPKQLAEFLTKACEDDDEYEKFWEWQKLGFSADFKQRLDDCAFYGAECRLCQALAARRARLPEEERIANDKRRGTPIHQYILKLGNYGQYFKVTPKQLKSGLDLVDSWTISLWLKLQNLEVPLLDREIYSLKIKKVWKRGYFELCVLDQCYLGSHPVVVDQWYHLVVVFDIQPLGENSVKFYINGCEDIIAEVPEKLPVAADYNSNPPLLVGTNKGNKNFFVGLLDDVTIYKRSFTAEDAKKLIWEHPSTLDPNVVINLHFNERPQQKYSIADDKYDIEMFGNIVWEDSITKPLVSVNPCL